MLGMDSISVSMNTLRCSVENGARPLKEFSNLVLKVPMCCKGLIIDRQGFWSFFRREAVVIIDSKACKQQRT